MENTIISSGPSQKFGSERPSSENSSAARSIQAARAARPPWMARGKEIKTAAVMAQKVKLEGRRQTRADDRADARLFIERTSEIPRREIRSESCGTAPSSGRSRPKLAAQLCLVRGAGGLAEHDLDGIAGNQMNQEKYQRQRAEERRQEQQESLRECNASRCGRHGDGDLFERDQIAVGIGSEIFDRRFLARRRSSTTRAGCRANRRRADSAPRRKYVFARPDRSSLDRARVGGRPRHCDSDRDCRRWAARSSSEKAEIRYPGRSMPTQASE